MHTWAKLYNFRTGLYRTAARQSRRRDRVFGDELVGREALELECVDGGHVRFECFVNHAVAVEERLGGEGLRDDGDVEGRAAAAGDVVHLYEG